MQRRTTQSERLTVLSEAEQFALYELPDFDDHQRLDYLAFADQEVALLFSRPGVHAQVHCALQIGYFKAKHAFFQFSWEETAEDRTFVLTRYFDGQELAPRSTPKHEHYAQRAAIVDLFGYRLWSAKFLPQLTEQADQIVRRDVAPSFIVAELIAFLNEHKVTRPGHTTLQTLISEALSGERARLGGLLAQMLDDSTKNLLQQLLVRDDTLSGLAVLKQDAKHFGYRQMVLERQKRATLEPFHRIAKALLPKLGISQQNLNYYASLANFYTIYDLRRLKPEQTHLYLLCYAWRRYRQFTDNLVDALGYHMKQLEEETKAKAAKRYSQEQAKREKQAPRVGRLLLLYVDDTVADTTAFGAVRQRAFKIMPKEALQLTGLRLSEQPVSKLALHWLIVDELSERARRHLRPLYVALEFSSTTANNPWLSALEWMKDVFTKERRLSQRPLAECPPETVPAALRAHLLNFDDGGTATGVRADRYEYWIYRQLRKRLKSGEHYLDDSMQHRCLTDELVSLKEKGAVLSQLDIPWLRRPIDAQLNALTAELHQQWRAFNRELAAGQLKHLEYDSTLKRLRGIGQKPKTTRRCRTASTTRCPFAMSPMCSAL